MCVTRSERVAALLLHATREPSGVLRGELVRARLSARPVPIEVLAPRLELIAQRQQRRLRQRGQILRHEPEPAQRAQLHGDAEAAIAAVLERETQVGR